MDLIFPKKVKELEKALSSLEEVVLIADTNILARDSMVIRFLYTSELFWKTLKLLLREEYKKDAPFAREVFRECRNVGIWDEKSVEIALRMLDDRNFCAHAYQEPVIQKIAQNIPEYYKLMIETLKKIINI